MRSGARQGAPRLARVLQQTTVSVLVTAVSRKHSLGFSGTLKKYIEKRKPSLVVVKR
jgi:hypothetical protein